MCGPLNGWVAHERSRTAGARVRQQAGDQPGLRHGAETARVVWQGGRVGPTDGKGWEWSGHGLAPSNSSNGNNCGRHQQSLIGILTIRDWPACYTQPGQACCTAALSNSAIPQDGLLQPCTDLLIIDSREAHAQRQCQHDQAAGAGDKQEAGHLRRSVAQRGSRLAIQAAVSGRGHACGGLRWQRMLVGRWRARWQKQPMQAG